MRRIRFELEGLPPKKGGDKSMWNKPPGKDTETKRLIALRKKARATVGGQEPAEGKVRLTLRVHIGFSDRGTGNTGPGDLDTFVAGVCDGLMAAHVNTRRNKSWHPCFDRPENCDVHPTKAIAYKDDSQIMEIRAEKTEASVPGKDSRYEVTVDAL